MVIFDHEMSEAEKLKAIEIELDKFQQIHSEMRFYFHNVVTTLYRQNERQTRLTVSEVNNCMKTMEMLGNEIKSLMYELKQVQGNGRNER